MAMFYTADRRHVLAIIGGHWRQKLISDAQCVALYILVLTRSRYQCRWLQASPGSSCSSTYRVSATDGLPLSMRDVIADALPELAEREFSLQRFFNCFRPRGMRQGALSVLSKWQRASMPLFVIVGAMSSPNLLRWQSKGFRCVSIFLPPHDWDRLIVDDKDALDFTLHDLDHAFKFIDDGGRYFSQVGFFSCLDKLVANDVTLAKWRSIDARFDRAFVYLMSDMNTHCAHQTEYLRAIVVESLLRRYQHARNEPLCAAAQGEFTSWKRGVENIVGVALFDISPQALTDHLDARGRAILQPGRLPHTIASTIVSSI